MTLETLGHDVPGGTCLGHAIYFFFLELPDSKLYIFQLRLLFYIERMKNSN